jgi:hypothetical protein
VLISRSDDYVEMRIGGTDSVVFVARGKYPPIGGHCLAAKPSA